MPATRPAALPRTILAAAAAAEDSQARDSLDDWMEEADSQARALRAAPPAGGPFEQFRTKLAAGEALSRSAEKLAAAVRFTGRVTISFHQGRITKTVLEESYSSRLGSSAT
jgi:hypothetical protein